MNVIARTTARTLWLGASTYLLLVLVLALAATAATAIESDRASSAYVDGQSSVEARLVQTAASDAQLPSHVGVLFDLAPGWHLYWKNPGATGLPTEVLVSADGASISPLQWPVPEAFPAGSSPDGAPSFGYEEQVLLFAAVALDPSFDSSNHALPRQVRAEADLLVCRNECIPAHFSLEAPLGVDPSTAGETRVLFEQYAQRLPESPALRDLEIEAFFSQSAIRPGDTFHAAIAVRSCRSTGRSSTPSEPCAIWAPDTTLGRQGIQGALVPELTGPIEFAVAGMQRDPSQERTHRLLLSGQSDGDESLAVDRLRGILHLRSDAGERAAVAVDLPIPVAELGAAVTMREEPWQLQKMQRAQQAPNTERQDAGLPLWQALLLALVGGLVLNLMPCVLPVLAIKVFGLAEMARETDGARGWMKKHGTAYTAGVLGSMLTLALVVVMLRAAGHAVGWGFQFQEPIYVACVSAVLVAFAMNLFGAFEINLGSGALATVGQGATGLRRSFFEGLLAVALATPCTAPFLGTAVGFAFASNPVTIFGIFGMIGLGLATPFAAISLVPGWARWVPRSGEWLLTVRAVLGFALIGTVVWLLSIFGASGGTDGVISLVAMLVAVAFSLFAFGRMQRAGHQRLTMLLGLSVVGFSLASLNSVSARVEDATRDTAANSALQAPSPAWQSWSRAEVAQILAAGQPVFVRFTADWCVTCKVNERVVLEDDTVEQALEDLGFARLVGDWTHRDETIRKELARHGRAGVPLYLVYSPLRPEEPVLLPELLTRDRVIGALRVAARDGRRERDRDHPETAKHD